MKSVRENISLMARCGLWKLNRWPQTCLANFHSSLRCDGEMHERELSFELTIKSGVISANGHFSVRDICANCDFNDSICMFARNSEGMAILEKYAFK